MSPAVVDAHGHYFPPSVMRAARDGRVPGVALDGDRLVFRARGRTGPIAPALFDRQERGRWMAAHGIARQVVAPEPETYGYDLAPERGAGWCRLVNESLAADLAGDPALIGLALVPLQHGESAAAELTHAVQKLDLRGCMVHTRCGGFDRRDLDPLWRAAVRLGVPVVIHPAHHGADARLGRYEMDKAVARPFETAVAAAELLCGGVYDRFPQLRVLLVHGGSALPYHVHALDQARRSHPEGWGARRRPSEYLPLLYFDTLLCGAGPLHYLVSQVGADHVLLGSDFPLRLRESDPLASLRAAGLPREAEPLMASENAARLFGLP